MATLKVLKFGNEDESVFAMFDGGHNNEVPKLLLDKLPDILQEELNHPKTGEHYMKYTVLAAHK